MSTLEYRKKIGELGEVFALGEIEKILPDSFEAKTIGERNGSDIIIHDGNGTKFYGEVKTAKEYFLDQYYNKKSKKTISTKRRGQFHIFKHQIKEADFFCFVIRFVNDDFFTTGEYEIFFALASDIQKVLSYDIKNKDYKFCISNLPKINVTTNFKMILKKLKNQREEYV